MFRELCVLCSDTHIKKKKKAFLPIVLPIPEYWSYKRPYNFFLLQIQLIPFAPKTVLKNMYLLYDLLGSPADMAASHS